MESRSMPAVRPRPYLLQNEIQHYAWGVRGQAALIPRLLGQAPEDDRPYAELWVGTHPKAPSRVSVEGENVPLDEWIRAFPSEILGLEVAGKFRSQLPFLLKILSVGEALSIQAHPNKAQAERLFQRDPEHYPDDNHKPELVVALDEMISLLGIKALPELVESLRRYPEIARMTGPEGTSLLKGSGPLSGEEAETQAARRLFSALIERSISHPVELETGTDALARRLRAGGQNLTEAERLFLELREKYPGPDVGLPAIFLLNLVHLKRGQGVFIAAGILHAHLKGNLFECMASSDNVIRVGLTPKFKDAGMLIEVLADRAGLEEIITGDLEAGEYTYPTPAREFRVSRWAQAGGDWHPHHTGGRLEILLVIQGEIQLHWESEGRPGEERFSAGQALLIPAILDEYSIRALGLAEVFRAEIPD